MPQMMPMFWSLMLILLTSLMFIVFSFMYFFYNLHLSILYKLKQKKNINFCHSSKSLKDWTWKW